MQTKLFTAVIHKESDIFVAECPDVGTVSQGASYDEAVENLSEATALYLEEFPTPDIGHPMLTTFEVASA